MKITETNLEGCFVCEPKIFEDKRGFFFESFKKNELEEALGYKVEFVQENTSISHKGVLRGLHYQKGKYAQAKLVQVINGEALDVVLDLRSNSKTYGEHFKLKLSNKNRKSIFIPKGMAHGFLSLTENTVFMYKCDSYYHSESERGIIYRDKELKIDWELSYDKMILSDKDLKLPRFAEFKK